MKKMFFLAAMAAVLFTSCGKKAATEEGAAEVPAAEAAAPQGDLPFPADKVMTDAHQLMWYSQCFEGTEVSYKALDVNADGTNDVIFRCAYPDGRLDYVIMTYKEGGEILDAVGTHSEEETKSGWKLGYCKTALINSFTETDQTWNTYVDEIEDVEITESEDWATQSSMRKEMTDAEVQAYIDAHKDITWVSEDLDWTPIK